MKKLVLFIIALIFLPLVSISQKQRFVDIIPIDNESQKISYSTVVDVQDKSKTELYSSAKEWMLFRILKSGNTLILDDKYNGKIICQGSFKVHNYFQHNLLYTIKVSAKDGKYKCEISNFYFQSSTDSEYTGIYWGFGVYSSEVTPSYIVNEYLEDYFSPYYTFKVIYKNGRYRSSGTMGLNSLIKTISDIDKEVKLIFGSLSAAMNEGGDW